MAPAHTGRDQRDTVIMFVDIMGASEVSNHKNLEDYFNFVNEFQAMFYDVCSRYIARWYPEDDKKFIRRFVRGDEGLLLMFRNTDAMGVASDVDAAINIALELKREWVCRRENRDRIMKAGLLPINLAIGIHVGKTHLECGEDDKWNSEGYAINLAKKVESFSREGRFTHIFLSEAAHGYLSFLADEVLYMFDDSQVFSDKGLSRDMRAYEVKHHYLPTDWAQITEGGSARSKAFLDVEGVDIEVLERALSLNPMNFWLIEEFIRSSMLRELLAMSPEEREGDFSGRFEKAFQTAERFSQSDQRDAGALFVFGFVEGEREAYVKERERYDIALKFTDQLAQAYWYKGLSFSFQLYEKTKSTPNLTIDELDDDQGDWYKGAMENYHTANLLRANSAWIPYDYGCELIRWAKHDEKLNQGFDLIELAVARLPHVAEQIPGEPYLAQHLHHPRLKTILGKDWKS